MDLKEETFNENVKKTSLAALLSRIIVDGGEYGRLGQPKYLIERALSEGWLSGDFLASWM